MPLDVDFLMGEGVEVEEGVTMASDWTENAFREILQCLEDYVGYPCSRKLMASSIILDYDSDQRELYKKLALRSVPPGGDRNFPVSCYASIDTLRSCFDKRSHDLVA